MDSNQAETSSGELAIAKTFTSIRRLQTNTLTLEGKTYILVPEAEYARLTSSGPPLHPTIDDQGTRPAVAFAHAAIARKIVELRHRTGLNQKDFATLAGIRAEVLNRAEKGVHRPSMTTLTKLQAAADRTKTSAKAPAVRRINRRTGSKTKTT